MRWISLVVIPIVAVGIAAQAHAYTDEEIKAAVIDTCHNAIKDGLKDPDSAKFNDWSAWEVLHSSKSAPDGMTINKSAGDRWFEAAGAVNAKNSFGGYTGKQGYYCDAVVTTDGNVHVRSHSVDDLIPTS